MAADEIKLENIYAILKDSKNPNFEYNKDELSAIYTRRNEYKKTKAEIIVAEDFIDYVRQNKIKF